jgi:pimeloyl-ACP methyl ester carboxylesterase
LRHTDRIVYRPIGALLLAVALALPAAGCSPARVAEATRVLADIQAVDGPSSLKRATRAPLRESISFAIDGRWRLGDLYLPADRTEGGVVLVPGLAPQGRDDPRLIAFATTLARARFAVLVPDLPRMRRFQVTAADAEPIADAIAFLDRRGDGRPLGLAAISFATGPAILALLQPQAIGRVDFVLAIGGYWDVKALITYVTTGYFRESEFQPWRYRASNERGKWVFLLTNATRLEDPHDRDRLIDIAGRRLDDPKADIDDRVAQLGDEGRAVYALMQNEDPDRTAALIATLPGEVRTAMDQLDLRHYDLTAISADFVLIHGRTDRFIPAEQSVALATALPADRVRLVLVDSLDHVEPTPMGIGDAIRLLVATYQLLGYRDAPGR